MSQPRRPRKPTASRRQASLDFQGGQPPAARRTRKPIPTDPYLWLAERLGAERALAGISKTEAYFGGSWGSKQRAYWRAWIADLDEHRPPGVTWRAPK